MITTCLGFHYSNRSSLTRPSEWQLVGYGRKSLKPHASKATSAKYNPTQPAQAQPTNSIQPAPRSEPIASKDQPVAIKTQPAAPKGPQKQQKVHVPYSQALKRPAPHTTMQPRAGYQSARGRGGSNVKRGQGTPARQPSRLFSDSPAKSKWRAGAQPTSEHIVRSNSFWLELTFGIPSVCEVVSPMGFI